MEDNRYLNYFRDYLPLDGEDNGSHRFDRRS